MCRMNTLDAIKLLEDHGYRVSQIHERRNSKLKNIALEDMTVQQRKTFLWRERNREKVLAYHREYNKRMKEANMSSC